MQPRRLGPSILHETNTELVCVGALCAIHLARIYHELLAATTDMAILPGVLGCRPLRRTVQVRLGTNTLRLPGGTSIFAVSRQQFMIYPG